MRFLAALLLSVSAYAQTGVLVQCACPIEAGTLNLTPVTLATVYPSTVENGVVAQVEAPTSHLYAVVGLSQIPGPGLITSPDWVIDRGIGGTQLELIALWSPPFDPSMNVVFVQYASVTGSTVEFTDQLAIVL